MSRAVNKARELTKKYQLSVPVNLEELLKKLDITLKVEPMESMSGFAYDKDGQRVIGVNSEEGPQRKRFSIAHELGHMYVHADRDILFDKKDAFVYFRDAKSSTGQDPQEIEANAFAAELLMPADKLRKRMAQLKGVDLRADDDKVKILADEYEVSLTAMTVRIDSLAKIPA